MYEKPELVQERELHRVISDAMFLMRKFKKISPEKEVYIQVSLHDDEPFYISGWSSWEDSRTGQKLILLIGGEKSVITDFGNVHKLEVFYKKPTGPGVISMGPMVEERPAQGK